MALNKRTSVPFSPARQAVPVPDTHKLWLRQRSTDCTEDKEIKPSDRVHRAGCALRPLESLTDSKAARPMSTETAIPAPSRSQPWREACIRHSLC